MRLLIIAPERYPIPSPRGTSVETCVLNIAHHLAKQHEVTVISRGKQGLARISSRGNLRIIRVSGSTRQGYIAQALRALSGKHFDHIQVDNRPGFLPLVKNKFPNTALSIYLHSLTFVTPPKASIARVDKQLKVANKVVVNSQSLKSCLATLYPGQSHKIEIVHLGVSTSMFRPPSFVERTQARVKYGVSKSFAIIYAGRLNRLKGIPVLIQAAEQVYTHVPNAKLLLIGSGGKAYTAYIKALARLATIPVEVIGHVPRVRMPQAYWAGDCLVCPSQGHEAFGLVAAEALATGLPTVASRNGGLEELITHNVNGLLVADYHSPKGFAKAILTIKQDPSLAKSLGREGRSSCEANFTWQKTSEQLHNLYFGGGARA